MKRVKLFLFASFLISASAMAQDVTSFLALSPDAQSAGMGGTGLAVINNGNTAIFHNASTIAFSQESMGGNYSFGKITTDYALQSASLFYRIGREGKQGVTVGYLHSRLPQLFLEDYIGADFRPYGWALEAGYFHNVAKNLSLSLTLKYIQGKRYPGSDAKGTAGVDIGASYHRNMSILDEYASWTIGFKAANIGGKLDGQKLPASLGLGGAIDLPFSMGNELQVALDLNYMLPSEYRHLQAGLGAEYNFLKYAVIRAGYHLGDKDKGPGSYGTLGCGIRYFPIKADFSYTLAGKDRLLHKCWMVSLGVAL